VKNLHCGRAVIALCFDCSATYLTLSKT